jgi:tryptophanyl-tRNA synthetase
LTASRDPHALARQTYEVAATWLALGLDPERVVFYRQSDIPEVFELMWILSCSTAKGLLNRAHAYSDVKQELAERLVAKFEDRRRTFTSLVQAPAGIDAVLQRGAQRARAAAAPKLAEIRRKIGIGKRLEA